MAVSSPSYHRVVDLQKLAAEVAKREGTSPTQIAALAQAVATLEYLKRVMRMKPNPKPIDVIPTGAARPMIDYKRLVRRPGQKALIDISEPKPPGPRTQLGSSEFYKAQQARQTPAVAPQDPAVGQAPGEPPKT